MIRHGTLSEAIQALKNTDTRGVTFISRNMPDKYVSYKCIYNKALRILYDLQNNGLSSGKECIFQINDNEQFIYYFWACILGGIIPIPVTVGINDEHKLKVLRIWETCNDPSMITDSSTLEKLISFGRQKGYKKLVKKLQNNSLLIKDVFTSDKIGKTHTPGPYDIAFIQFSSGSTGNPKGVVLTHNNLLTNIHAIKIAIQSTANDSFFSWMPLTHDMGLIGFHICPCAYSGQHNDRPAFNQFSYEWR